MANRLKMAVVNAVLTLKELGWSQRRIAQVLGIDRETVARYVHSPPAEPKPATNPIPGLEASEPSSSGGSSGPESLCEPFRAVIEEKLQQGLTGQRIYQDLVDGHGSSHPAAFRSRRPSQGHPGEGSWTNSGRAAPRAL